MADKKITSISDLIKELEEISSADSGPIWYRGHADSAWRLESHFDRLRRSPKETELINRFRQNANLLLDSVPRDPYDFGWLFLMQHYGVPTRLLDWSESPLVALYFAVNDASSRVKKKDAALWVLYPKKLNTYSMRRDVYIPSFEDDWLNNYSIENYALGKDAGLLPIAVLATRNNPRIQAQLGVFTISHIQKMAIENIEGGQHCTKLIIPAGAKQKIRDELRTLGISKFQIFPELSSIGEILKGEVS